MKRSRVALWMFMIMISIMVLITMMLLITTPSGLKSEHDNARIVPEFYDAGHESINLTELCFDIGSEGAVYTKLPDAIANGSALCLKSYHVYFAISLLNADEVDGNELALYSRDYSGGVLEPLYTDSPGAVYATIPLSENWSGKEIKIDYKLAYNKNGYGFTEIYIDQTNNYIIDTLGSKLGAILLCTIYVTIGSFLLIVGIVTFKISKHNQSFFWLGAFALSVAFYCLLETQFLSIFANNVRLVHLLVMFSMCLIPLPAVAYVDSLLSIKPAWLTPVFSILICVTFFVMTILNALNIYDYHDILFLMQGYIVIAVLIMSIGIIRYIVNRIKKDKDINIYVWAMIIGVLGIMVTAFIDLFRYYINEIHDDPAATLRFGFLIFLGGFTIASSERVITAFRDSARSKIISKLAYEDGLTGLLNRTSYQEMMEKIDTEHIKTGVIMMDLNNLKYINDNFGHDDGDAMLLAASKLIRETFDNIQGALCYRIGGDEFVVLIQNNNIENSCEDGIKNLREKYSDFNNKTQEVYKLVIAAGYSICDFDDLKDTDKLDTNIFKLAADKADALMYENKRFLKSKTA